MLAFVRRKFIYLFMIKQQAAGALATFLRWIVVARGPEQTEGVLATASTSSDVSVRS
jgi:hypothetical protein